VPEGALCAGNGTRVETGEVVIDAVTRPLKTKRKQGTRTAKVKLKLNALGKALLKSEGTLSVRVTAAITTGPQTSLQVEKTMGFVR
jgi:aconitase B